MCITSDYFRFLLLVVCRNYGHTYRQAGLRGIKGCHGYVFCGKPVFFFFEVSDVEIAGLLPVISGTCIVSCAGGADTWVCPYEGAFLVSAQDKIRV